MKIKKFNTKILNEQGYWVNDEDLESKINDFLTRKGVVFYNLLGTIDYILILYDELQTEEVINKMKIEEVMK